MLRNSEYERNPFKSGIVELLDILSKKNVDLTNVNVILDRLNAVHFQHSNHGEEHILDLIVQCCTAIPTTNSLLVAKSCNLILNHVLRNKLTFNHKQLKSILVWTNGAFQESSDVAYIDLLQLINIILKTHPNFFKENGKTVVPFLFDKLESKASVSLPTDIKLLRVFCLKSLSQTVTKDDRTAEVDELCDILYNQSTDNLLFHAQIWRSGIETFDSLVSNRNSKWLMNKLNEIIGFIEVAATLGLKGNVPSLPKQVFPSSYFMPEPANMDTPVKNTNVNQPGKKKHKSKAKRHNWVDRVDGEEMSSSRGATGFETFQPTTFTSDSDYSDTESGQTARLAKEQAKTRHATFNFIIQLSNVIKGKQLYGYYNVLLNALILSIRHEISNKARIGALSAVSALFMHGKPFLAQAQHSDGISFVGFSGSLSELVTGLHSCLWGCLSSVPPSNVLPPLLQTLSRLISVSPYHRLRPTLLTNTFSSIHPYLRNKDPAVCVCALKCLNEIALLNPGPKEQKDVLKKGMKFSTELPSSDSWIISFLLPLLKDEGTNDTVRVTCWQLTGNLFKYNFELLEENLSEIEELLFKDLKTANFDIQLHATFALNKLLEGMISKEKLVSYNKEVWLKLLNGPLITLLQSPEVISCEACDCLANMGPIIFNSLKVEEQILVVTLIFGCINHEKPVVRVAAVHTLGIFLLFPQMTHEQFLYDAKDLLIKSLSDTCLTVRIKAAWAVGNLVDLVINKQDEEILSDFGLKGILVACLTLVKDDDLVKTNILRAIGLLLLALKDEDVADAELDELVEKSVQFLLKCSSSGTMKMRWNACHAISTMLKNRELLSYSKKWMVSLVQTLCNLILSCNNFKVRANACTALCKIPSRQHFGSIYPLVWTSLLDGLDNAVNLPDFKEYKHQASLKQHLCSAVCHITTLLAIEDIPELAKTMDYRLENLKEHMLYFQKNTLPEQTATSVAAANNIQNLIQLGSTSAHRQFLVSLKEIFSVLHVG